MKMNKLCLTRDEIAKRRYDLATKPEISQKADLDAAELESDLIPGVIARELAEIGYCILYFGERDGHSCVHVALPEEFEITNRPNGNEAPK